MRQQRVLLSIFWQVASLVVLVLLVPFLLVLLFLVAALNFCAVVLWAGQWVVSLKVVQSLRRSRYS